MSWHDDWSQGWARKREGRPETWGEFYAHDRECVVRLYRGKHNRCRFYNQAGEQVEGEQSNVVPAIAGAMEVMHWTAL